MRKRPTFRLSVTTDQRVRPAVTRNAICFRDRIFRVPIRHPLLAIGFCGCAARRAEPSTPSICAPGLSSRRGNNEPHSRVVVPIMPTECTIWRIGAALANDVVARRFVHAFCLWNLPIELQGPFRGLCLCPGKLRFPTAETGVGRDSVRMLSQCDGKPSTSRCLDIPVECYFAWRKSLM